ncbi:hypothetical protein O1B03_003525 [Vibrio cholerae]|uniref:hypothetical protein n=1 Tax=Vibrio cholerae TaxID=666 RepID=UPI003018DD2F|nr:hypothetical protein [Vibrio cholerae]EJL6604674.1 hypothetical protein [Vibrio cholerae]EJL6622829.1 hypothetical protein [Vibrio cholerae]EKF9063534.1 hypothetical protein [Vibrio cholerae]
MSEAVIGLVGVVVGVLATGLKDWLVVVINTKRRKRYLATRVVSLLDIFVDNCASVVKDDGTFRGQPNSDGYYYAQVPVPDFNPLSLDVDWLSIKSELMHQILSFPNDIYIANSKIQSVREYVADPPDFPEYFEERQYQYSILAIKATQLINQLNKEASFKGSVTKWNWFESDLFENTVKDIEVRRAQKFT